MTTAFEAITARQSWYASEDILANFGVQFDAAGQYAKADGSRPFAGVVQYGGKDGEMITVVKGAFPARANEVIEAGDMVTIDATEPGTFKVADAGDTVYGVALTGADQGELFTLSMIEVPYTVSE